MEKQKTNGDGELKDSMAIFRCGETEMRGTLVKLSRFAVVFEVYSAENILRLSEILEDFRIIFNERTIYSGRATVQNLMTVGQTVICATTLNENSWAELQVHPSKMVNGYLKEQFSEFTHEWQKVYRVLP